MHPARLPQAQLRTHGDWLFATPTGGPVNPRTDYSEWKLLLARAGLRDGRLHDARHTAATVLLILESPNALGHARRGARKDQNRPKHRKVCI